MQGIDYNSFSLNKSIVPSYKTANKEQQQPDSSRYLYELLLLTTQIVVAVNTGLSLLFGVLRDHNRKSLNNSWVRGVEHENKNF